MKRSGLTLMELLTVISILATLAALLYPVYTQVRKRVYVTRCAAQMKQLGVAFRMYAHDYGDDSPYGISYAEKLYPHYISDERVLVCPYFAAMTPETVEEMHAFWRKRFGYPWSSYETESPRGADEIARKYPDEVISFAEIYSVLGDRVVIASCSVHRIGCPQGTNFGPSPKGQEFCLKNCIDPFALRFLSPEQRKETGEFCDAPPGPISDLSQPWIVLRWDGSVSFDYSGGWKGPDTAFREFLERVNKSK